MQPTRPEPANLPLDMDVRDLPADPGTDTRAAEGSVTIAAMLSSPGEAER
jgi:hypothetical protein